MVTMSGVVLLGDSTVQHVKVGVPDHGHGQVLLQIIATDISPKRRTMAGDLGLIDMRCRPATLPQPRLPAHRRPGL